MFREKLLGDNLKDFHRSVQLNLGGVLRHFQLLEGSAENGASYFLAVFVEHCHRYSVGCRLAHQQCVALGAGHYLKRQRAFVGVGRSQTLVESIEGFLCIGSFDAKPILSRRSGLTSKVRTAA